MQVLCWVFPAAAATPRLTSHANNTGFSLRKLTVSAAAVVLP